jgi:hypothetical protein
VRDLPLLRKDALPPIAPKGPMLPALRRESEVGIPHHTGPVDLESLDMELSGDVFEIVGRADVVLPVEEPVHGVDGSLDVQRMRLKPAIWTDRRPP